MSKKQKYNPNSTKHNDDWHNEHREGSIGDDWEESGEYYREKTGVPRHREFYKWDRKEEFGASPNFMHKLDEIPKDADVPPELLKDMFNGLVVKMNRLIDWHNSLEEFEYNKIKNERTKNRD